ncbi:MAG: 30S ribosome-binding factor RbfA [Clostridiales bacterium]|nr:30S ribosome-binding factor RbfA [Clostridiales bacterium]
MGRQQNFRGERLGEEIRKIASDLLSRELKDPAFEDGLISISYVKATSDGSFATVYFTSLGADEAAVVAGFEKAKGFIRNEIGRKLGIRRAPELRFKVDAAASYGQRIDELLGGLDLPADEAPIGRDVAFSELPEIVDAYERYALFTHAHMDGDTLGSAVAFAEAMREIGREAWVVVDDEPPRTLAMIKAAYVVGADEAERVLDVDPDVDSGTDADGGEDAEQIPYLAILMDFADLERLEGREALFDGAAESLCIDHHAVTKPGCDYNYVEPGTAATAEIVYKLLRLMSLPVTERVATALYIGVVTDTGRFQYTNTTAETHRIAAELLEAGADFDAVYQEVYQNIKAEKFFAQREMLNTLDIFAGGKAAMVYICADTLAELGAGEDETDGMSEALRGIIGVEVAVCLRERPDGKIKASMRSKGWFDVAAFAAEFGGGGHVRAAGFTSGLSMDETCKEVKGRLEIELEGGRLPSLQEKL